MSQITLFAPLGLQVDRGSGTERWNKWRPTVSIFQHEDFLIDRLELMIQSGAEALVKTVVADIRSVSPETEVITHTVDFDDPWDFEEVYGKLLDFCRGYHFRKAEYLWHITTGTHVGQICAYLLTEARFFPGKLLQTSPPTHLRKKGRTGRNENASPGQYQIIDLDLSRYDSLRSRFKDERSKGLSFLKSGIDTRNKAFNTMIEELENVAIRSDRPILLLGPTGAGKSLLARRIYELKKKRHQVKGRFIEVNCSTLRGDQALSALFGHAKGAFTGAQSARNGLLKTADDGMVFLDEIGDLGLEEQTMLLKALEEKRFLPLGADKETESDFQLIAGTNKDLEKRVITGDFREDLLTRINLWTYRLPGLKDRPEDIEPNLDFELAQYVETSGDNISFERRARKHFLDFAVSSAALWAGNFRDLNATVVRMCTLAKDNRITVKIVDAEIERLKAYWFSGRRRESDSLANENANGDSLTDILPRKKLDEIDLFERLQLAAVVDVCLKKQSLAEAGRALYSQSRLKRSSPNDSDRLRKYLGKFGLEWNDLR